MWRNLKSVLAEGLLAGVLGYLVVVLIVAGIDIASGRSPFHTVAVLGAVAFFGVRDPASVTVWAGPVLAFNGVHMLVFLVFGTLMAWLTSLAERGEQMWYVSLVALLFVLPHVIGLPIWFDGAIARVISLWSVVAATAAAALVVAAWLWHAHPRLRRAMAEETA